jgi:hypothetical protein
MKISNAQQILLLGILKKASSTFVMAGLTRSANGHFAIMCDNALIDNAKWRRRN